MHFSHEILSLILLPLLPPLAAAIVIDVIFVIVHFMIIETLAFTFYARLNPATPSPQSQWQIVSFGGGGRGTTLRPPHRMPSFVNVCLSFVCWPLYPIKLPRPLHQNHHTATRTRGGGAASRRLPPPHVTAAPAPAPAAAAGAQLLLIHVVLLHGLPARHGHQVDDQCEWMRGAIFPVWGCRLWACSLALLRTWWPTSWWGVQGGWRWSAESGEGGGARVLQLGRHRCHARRNTPMLPLAKCWESRTRTCAGLRRGSATANPSQT
jgi:hypothetical protein